MAQSDWRDAIGLGVAGNFTGHLEQAGEAADFKGLAIADASAPKGVFPFYVPGPGTHFLHCYPVSSDIVRLASDEENHQIEPELALHCELEYEHDRVVAIRPREAMAHNDFSIRRAGARKISEKKNWGPESKGTSSQSIPIDRFEAGGVLDDYRIASFLQREGELFAYGVDSSVASYSYMYGQLIDWLIVQLNEQGDDGPLEDLSEWLAIGGRPSRALISIGATRYTEFGEKTFLERGDRSIVAVYDANRHDLEAMTRIVRDERRNRIRPTQGLSLLDQKVL